MAAVVLSLAVLAGATGAGAAPAALVPPLRPAPTEVPDLGRSPCIPLVGCDPLGGLGQDAAKAIAGAVFGVFATFVADGVKSVLDEVAQAMTATTAVNLDRDWFDRHAAVMRGLAIVILLPLMLIGLVSAVIHRDPHQLLRAGLVYVPVAIVGGAAAIGLTDLALKVTDGLTAAVTGDLAGDTTQALAALRSAVIDVSATGGPSVGLFLSIVVLLVLMAGALLIWIELLLRTSAIYVVVLFLPVAMSGLVWRATVAWTRRMIEVLVALILSKFVIVVVIDLAAGMIVSGDGIGTVLQGATLMLLAACAPFALLRLVPLAEAGVIGQLERMERRPIAAATRASVAVARTLVGGVEGAGAGAAVSQNGGDSKAAFTSKLTEGGELNDVNPPEGWSARADRPHAMAALGSGGGGAPGRGAGGTFTVGAGASGDDDDGT
jgi:hypothetical protein